MIANCLNMVQVGIDDVPVKKDLKVNNSRLFKQQVVIKKSNAYTLIVELAI